MTTTTTALEGIYSALLTPFREDETIDRDAIVEVAYASLVASNKGKKAANHQH